MSGKVVQTEIELPDGKCVCIDIVVKNVPNSQSIKIRLLDKHSAIITKPRYVSLAKAYDFLAKNKSWLAKQYCKISETKTLAQFLKTLPEISVQDKLVKLEIITSRTSPFFLDDFENGKLILAPTEVNFDLDIEKLFVDYAFEKLSEIVKLESVRTELAVKKVSVRDQSSRWGSCSSSGTLSLNWRIMLLNEQQQKYIICHELAHTKFMNHSVSFWIFLNRICPDAQKLDREVEKLAQNIFNIKLTKL